VPFFIVQGGGDMLAAPSQLRVNRMAALRLEIRNAIAHCGFKGCDIRAGVGNHSAQAGMEFARTRGAGHFRDIARMEAATRQNRDAISSLLDERA